MPNETYGPPLAGRRNLYNTMDHCYGRDDVMTVAALGAAPLRLKEEKHNLFMYLYVSLMMSCLFFPQFYTNQLPMISFQSRWNKK